MIMSSAGLLVSSRVLGDGGHRPVVPFAVRLSNSPLPEGRILDLKKGAPQLISVPTSRLKRWAKPFYAPIDEVFRQKSQQASEIVRFAKIFALEFQVVGAIMSKSL